MVCSRPFEAAMASVELRPGEVWEYDPEYNEYTVGRPGAGDHSEIIKAYEVDA